jgi:Domain of unknown function (DUF4145)
MKMSGTFYAQWFDDGPVQAPPASLVHGTLRWILKRLNDGLVQPFDGRPTTRLTIGKADSDDPLPATLVSEMQKRRVSVNLAGAFAEARERGVEPKHVEMSEQVRFRADESAYVNTEFHYAMQLLDILPEMRRRSFELSTLPLLGHASEELVDLLHEATRAHLTGLHSACVALCRAALERALVERVPSAEVVKQRSSGRRGHLENLINAAKATGLLDQSLTDFAHGLRTRSNDVLHGIRGKALVEDSFVIISDARLLVERLFSAPQADQDTSPRP